MCTRSVRSSIFSLRGIRAAMSAGIRSFHRVGGSSTCASPEFTHIFSVIPSPSFQTQTHDGAEAVTFRQTYFRF